MLIPEDDSVRLLSHILEGVDYTKLYKAYSSTGRKPAVDPKIMFKVVTYAYSNNIYSNRKIETAACKRDINFMRLLQSEAKPDHSTIYNVPILLPLYARQVLITVISSKLHHSYF